MLRLLGTTSYNNTQLTMDRTLFLVALLACQQKWMTREELMLLLWDDTSDETMIRSRLRQVVYRTKQLPFGADIQTSHQGLWYTGLSDVQQFCTAIAERDWQTAISCYQGQLLHGAVFNQAELEEWFALERATLAAQFCKAALEQALLLEATQAALLLEQALKHEPLNEDLLGALLHYAKVNPEVGQRAFEQYQTILFKELQLTPAEDLQKLAGAFMDNTPIIPPRAKLPVTDSVFVGRQAELDFIGQRLTNPHCRVLSLVGIGGIGKTRLALEIAARVPAQFSDGAVFVDLAKLTDAELVPNAILEALAERPQQQPLERLQTILANKALLLVLDNFEHVLTARIVVDYLIEHTSALRILITSRESLGLRKEHILDISGMPIPDTLFPLETQDAALLFSHVAQRHSSQFRLLRTDVAAFTRIFQAVAGMPLGLELAASWTRTFSLTEIAVELEKSLDLLELDAPDIPARHKSFAAVFHSSWTLLNPQEQLVLAQLSLFQGGFDKDMAVRLTSANVTTLLRLVNKSLVSRREQRFFIHELIRQYSEKQLSPEQKHQTMQVFLAVNLYLAELWYKFRSGNQVPEWTQRIDLDHDNIRAGLTWALQHDLATGIKIVAYLEHYWFLRGHHREGLDWANQFLAQYTTADTPRLLGLWTQISMSKELGQYDFSLASLHKYCELALQLGLKQRIGGAEKLFGFIAHEQGDLETAKTYLLKAIDSFNEFNGTYGVGNCYISLSSIALEQGDLQLAKTYADEALRTKRLVADTQGISYAMAALGDIAGKQGDYELATVLHEESLHLKRSLGDQQGIANSLLSLGIHALEQNQFETAIEHHSQALEILARLERKYAIIQVLHGFAELAHRLGQYDQALFFMSATIQLNFQISRTPPVTWLEQQTKWRERSQLTPAKRTKLEFEAEKLGLSELVTTVFTWKNKILDQQLWQYAVTA
jgi:predicted ATPase/DNA-binding SARP family transcriptional activator